MSAVTTHVLDAALGRPATGVTVRLAGAESTLAEGVTDGDGRIPEFGPDSLAAGDYEVIFETGDYFARQGTETFYPRVRIPFRITDPAQHYHVPLLLSPFAFSTYRGS
ncbi:MAG: hydroxyisourate hydrolase [Saccharopolyspora sp.]|uniref:hydroxyisourate hydrolase n=1 Tax=Saccharopolyspora TaxID=1835 RepID=UPI00190A8A7D|nr:MULTISPECIES: hydroxyisourate hydrolase [unclassified Saccharopolyspora]MBK0865819.1 hydroxyisourate hydrolase [Saccharopolyspora sp. HNM0986]MBQ6642050.1 hydroxyisourate hydrolase [Saccharopolyspora sp.]